MQHVILGMSNGGEMFAQLSAVEYCSADMRQLSDAAKSASVMQLLQHGIDGMRVGGGHVCAAVCLGIMLR